MRGLALLLAPALALFAREASAQPVTPERKLDLSPLPARTHMPEPGPVLHGFGTLALGKGLRFNNPYRLATPLGDDPESMSTTATYLDLGVGAAFGPVDGLQHGGEVSLSIAMDGVAQEVLGLSYVALLPLGNRFLVRGRAGVPIVLEPDANVGLEIGAGGAFLITGGFGLTGELVGSLFYGAGTLDRSTTTIPLLSLELGVFFDYEVLP